MDRPSAATPRAGSSLRSFCYACAEPLNGAAGCSAGVGRPFQDARGVEVVPYLEALDELVFDGNAVDEADALKRHSVAIHASDVPRNEGNGRIGAHEAHVPLDPGLAQRG